MTHTFLSHLNKHVNLNWGHFPMVVMSTPKVISSHKAQTNFFFYQLKMEKRNYSEGTTVTMVN